MPVGFEYQVHHRALSLRIVQSFQRDKDGWFETSSKGIVRRCTAEQTLSHLLPALAGVSREIVKVERISPEKPRALPDL